MEDYKLRMINEYKELKGKYDRLHRMLVKYDAGKLDFTPTCPIDLLRKQASIMGQYLYALETRAVIEGVSLNAEDSNDKAESNEAKCDFNYCCCCCNGAEARIKSETKPGKPKQERMVTRTVSNAKGEEVVYYNILYGFGRQDVLEKLYHYEQEEEEEKMEKDKIKVGDTVKVTEGPVLKGKTGIVRRIYCTNNGKPYVVNFDENFCWAFSDHEIVKVKSKKTQPCIVVYRDGDTVTVKDLETGEEASAVCSKKDTFDIHTGAFIAMSRLTHFDTDIRLMRLEMEQIDSYISDIKMRFGALMGEGYKYQDFDEEEEV